MDLAGVGFCVVVLLFIGFLAGLPVGESNLERRATEAGAAEYVVDAKTGETEFRWITAGCAE